VTYLIDTGTVESWGAVSAALRALDVRRVDGVILTHCDKDHAGGIQALASSSIEVGQWIASKYYCEVTEDEHPAVLAAGFCTEHSAKSRTIGYEEETSPTLRAGVVPAAIALEHHPADSRIGIAEDAQSVTIWQHPI
jgi:glyoxylase-like metal-dependent hydrolase (beta-lactamase superfamily II)